MNFADILVIFSLLSSAQAFVHKGLSTRQFGITTKTTVTTTSLNMVVTKEDLLGARDAIDKILDEKNCGPIFVRLAWHDSGTLDLWDDRNDTARFWT